MRQPDLKKMFHPNAEPPLFDHSSEWSITVLDEMPQRSREVGRRIRIKSRNTGNVIANEAEADGSGSYLSKLFYGMLFAMDV